MDDRRCQRQMKELFGACGDGVHGVGAVVVGQDHPEVVGGRVFGAAVHLLAHA